MLPQETNILQDTTVITGLGRSGTTYIAHALHNAGYDVGADPKGIPEHGGGLENSAFTLISRADKTDLPKSSPRIIKDPTFAVNLDKWISLGQYPKDIFFMTRDIDACLASHNVRNDFTKMRLYNDWYTGLRNVITHGLPVTIIPFPEIATNQELANLLRPWIDDPWPVLQKTYNAQKVHF